MASHRRRRRSHAPPQFLPTSNLHLEPSEDYTHNLLVACGVEGLVCSDYAGGLLGEYPRSLLNLARVGNPKLNLKGTVPARLAGALRKYLTLHNQPRPARPPAEPARTNLATIADILSFTANEQTIVAFLAALEVDVSVRQILDDLGPVSMGDCYTLVAAATALPVAEVAKVLGTKGRLATSGMIQVEEHGDVGDRLQLRHGVSDLLAVPGLTHTQFVHQFLPVAKPTELVLGDFAHLAEPIALATTLLRRALERQQVGVNVLLVGPTGTGKSALAALLAQEAGAALHAAGTEDSEGAAPSAHERLSSLLLGHRLFAGGGSLIVFDEMEDLFCRSLADLLGGHRQSGISVSKQWFNLLLEENPVPTLWISNSVEGLDPAFLRRFSYAIEFTDPGIGERVRALRRHLPPETPSVELEQVARRCDVSPAQFASAARAAGLLAEDGVPTLARVEGVLAPIQRIMSGGTPTRREDFDASAFRLDGVRAKANLTAIADRLAGWKQGGGTGISLCLYGPPGTGKTEFARYLAFRASRPVVYRRGSDLLSKWVGESEKNIAAAFREGEADGAVLIFDEVDSMLRNREGARQSWEVSQVNEFLQQLEAYRGLVVCTTNLLAHLDPAALRRFVFKVEFEYAGPSQARVLFDTLLAGFLAQPLSAADEARLSREFSRLSTLAPGDFAAVARRLRALGESAQVDELLASLAEELAVKSGPRSAVGFG